MNSVGRDFFECFWFSDAKISAKFRREDNVPVPFSLCGHSFRPHRS